MSRGRYVLWVAGWAIAFAVLHYAWQRPRGTVVDAAWMAHAGERLAAGDVLYRDVFCGATPLAFWIQALAGDWFGHTVGTVRGTLHLLFVAQVVMVAAIGESLRISRWAMGAALGGMLVWAAPLTNSTYSAWGIVFLLGAFWAALRAPADQRWAYGAGLSAGLAFGAKQNLGLLALAMVVVMAPRAWVRMAAAFGLVVGAMGVVVGVSGGWDEFWYQGFAGKVTYLQRAGISYWQWLSWTPRALLYLLPLGLLGLVGERGRWPVALLGVVSLAAVYPRPDPPHMVMAAPGFLVVFGVVAARRPLWTRGAAVAMAILVGAQLAAEASWHWWQGPAVVMEERGLRGAPLEREEAAKLRGELAALSGFGAGRKLFLLHPAAAMYYAGTGLKNPVRYDFPLVTTFGPTGQARVGAAIRAGQIREVCLLESGWPELPPEELMAIVRAEMRPVGDSGGGPCRLYRAP